MPTTQELVGARVRELRKAKGWTLETLAEKADKHYTYIGGLERGVRNVTLEVLQDVAAALGVPIKQLFAFLKHPLEEKLNATADDILSAIDKGFRATIDAKGKLAEYFLFQELAALQIAGSITDLVWFDEDGKPDFEFAFNGRRRRLECKNIRSPDDKRKNDGWRVELQKTRNSKDGTPTRAYPVDHFDLLSVCLFNRAGKWEYLHIASHRLERRPDNKNLLVIMQAVPESSPSWHWKRNILEALSDLET
jgi:transcriptional regulator with XRE-family HTH domain